MKCVDKGAKWMCTRSGYEGGYARYSCGVSWVDNMGSAFDCTSCSGDIVAAGLQCTNPNEEDLEQPPYFGNELRWKIDCINRLRGRFDTKNDFIVGCLTKCAGIP